MKNTEEHEYRFEVHEKPDFALLSVHLNAGQKILAEPSSMVAMTPGIKMKAGLRGGLGKSLGRMLGGESLIVNTFIAEKPGELMLAPGAAGDLTCYHLSGNGLMLQRGAFVACGEHVELTGKWQGAKGFFSGEGLVLLKATGVGDIFFNAYGAILEVDVRDGFAVDTGYVVAFEDTLGYSVSVMPGLRPSQRIKTLFFGSEGIVCHFSGRGRLWIQTRDIRPFLAWVHPFRPVKSRN
jgi:uncharacterized protein (TIGR00266 family)